MPEPVDRPAARVLVLDPEDRILLFRFHAPRLGRRWWLTPGGGIEPDESPEQAALRELAEETGLTGVELSPCVWVREHVFPWGDAVYRQMERFYVARTEHFEPAGHLPDGSELFRMEEHRWWSPADLAGSRDETFAPRRLPVLLGRLLASGWPPEPIDVGL